jgi:hypothetical protein
VQQLAPLSAASFDHLVSAAEQRKLERNTERFCRLEINGHLNFRGLLAVVRDDEACRRPIGKIGEVLRRSPPRATLFYG